MAKVYVERKLPGGGPGVLVRDEEDGDPRWAEIELLTNAKGVVVWDGVTGAQPGRPEGYLSIEWQQPVDPAAVAEDADTWIDTSV